MFARLKDTDILASFLSSKVTIAAGAVTMLLFLAALLAPWIAPTDPFNPATNYLSNSLDPPSFITGGDPQFLLGTDDQGRDMLSAILYGLRVSLAIGFCSVALGAALGVGLGLISGYAGGFVNSVIMRIADVQLTFPAILIALLLDGVAHAMLKAQSRRPRIRRAGRLDRALVLGAIRPHRARFDHGREEPRLRAGGAPDRTFPCAHPGLVMSSPTSWGRCMVIATINLALAIITEATLSFLGVGLPPTQPSLGTLIRIGAELPFLRRMVDRHVSQPDAGGAWCCSVNLLGDWLRDALNPRLK